jgi:hypothetical protein
MIQVIADATLLRYLIEIEVVDILPVLFGQIMAPPAVIHDLQHINTPAPVRPWIASLPSWVVVQAQRSTADPDLSRSVRASDLQALYASQLGAIWY